MLNKIKERKEQIIAWTVIIVVAIAFIAQAHINKYEYSGCNDASVCRVEFGDGFFYVKDSVATYAPDGKNLNLEVMAGDYCQSVTELTEKSNQCLIYECIPEHGTEIRIHGGMEEYDIPYIEARIMSRYSCVVRVFFYDKAGERVLQLEDGSKISPLMAYLIEFALDGIWNHPEEFVERMHRLEAWEKSARAEISIRTPRTR